jgi:hypothetical protein
MPRKHLFVIVVLLGAAAVAGLLAMTRTQALGSPASTSAGNDAAISFRMKKLDRLEASLAKQIAAQDESAPAAPITVYRRAPGPVLSGGSGASEHEHDSESAGEDDRDD